MGTQRATGMQSSLISGRTRLLGVLADPVAQARSPAMANILLQEKGLFGEYALIPLHASPDGLIHVIAGLRRLQNFAGTIVSMPHKTAVVPLLDEVSPEAQLVGSVNVIRREWDGRLVGSVFDGKGFVAGLRSAGHEVRGKRCLLVGAGGAAAAVAFALAKYGCASLTIVNRTEKKAVTLAAQVQEAWPQTQIHAGAISGKNYDIAINATSLCMKSDDELPMSMETIEASSLVAECVIAPEMTRLLTVAKTKGRAIHTGVPMLAAQMNLMLRFMRAGDC
jgi:shikimate dehydrogenase